MDIFDLFPIVPPPIPGEPARGRSRVENVTALSPAL
jgi:hypothetical protein